MSNAYARRCSVPAMGSTTVPSMKVSCPCFWSEQVKKAIKGAEARASDAGVQIPRNVAPLKWGAIWNTLQEVESALGTHSRLHGHWNSWKGQGVAGLEWVCGCTTSSMGLTRRDSPWPTRDNYAQLVLCSGSQWCYACCRIQKRSLQQALTHSWPLSGFAKAYSGRALIQFQPYPETLS